MSNNNENKLVPKFRFPGFSKNWFVIPVSEVCDVFRGSPLSKAELDENGSKPCIHYGELFTKYSEVISSIYSKTNRKDGFKSKVGDILMPSSDVTPDGLAKASVIMHNDVILGGDMNILRPIEDIKPIFLSYLLNRSKREIIKLVSGTTVKHIYPSQISNCHLPIVYDDTEQQRIAACLSSLDEVIAGEGQKLELLKQHKKGLLQNLFPHPSTSSGGSTVAEPVEANVPRLRFKEFENSGEWVVKKLGDMTLKVGSGVTPFGGESVYKKNGRPFVRSQNVGWGFLLLENIAFIDDETHQSSINTEIMQDDVLLNITGASIGRSAVANNQVCGGNVNQHVCIIRTLVKHLNPFFLCQYLNSSFGQNQIDSFQAGGNRQGLNFAQIRSLSIPIPPTLAEQQRIAACLSSLDDLINAQSQKIEALKEHKKGLLQGLFPQM